MTRLRILVIDTYYPPFLDAHYVARPGLGRHPYSEQLVSLMGRSFGTSDAYSRNFRTLGHEASDLIVNCFPLQERWEGENHGKWTAVWRRSKRRVHARLMRRFDTMELLQGIAFEQVHDHDPDLLYIQDVSTFGLEQMDALRAEGRILVGQTASGPPEWELLHKFDLVVSALRHFVQGFRSEGISSEFLRIGFDESVLDRLRSQGVNPSAAGKREHQVSFVGGLNPNVHGRRVRWLERLCRSTDLGVWGYGVEELKPGSPILSRYRGEAWGLDMYRLFANSKIVINAHIDVAQGEAANMRLFEATGAGALMLTEDYENLPEMFEPGRELVTYRDVDDLAVKIRYYLQHEDERLRIAEAGQARTLAEHTYRDRIAELDVHLRRHFS